MHHVIDAEAEILADWIPAGRSCENLTHPRMNQNFITTQSRMEDSAANAMINEGGAISQPSVGLPDGETRPPKSGARRDVPRWGSHISAWTPFFAGFATGLVLSIMKR